jgi:hypothetical protein
VTSRLTSLCFDANDPLALARFWSGVLQREPVEDPDDGPVLPPPDEVGFRLRFVPTSAPKVEPNRIHFDLPSDSWEAQRATVDRALALGGRHIDVGQLPEEEHVVLADPEGNEFCVIEPGNNFLANTAVIGALSCDGSRAVGLFWSAALHWPLVWDEGEETAIQSPAGGTKIAWGGPPDEPKQAKNRLYYEITPVGDAAAEVERLVSLGARRIDADHGAGWLALADPDDNEFFVRATR